MGILKFRAAAVVLVICHSPARMGAASVEFNRDVRPILSEKCFTCHGPDAVVRKVSFRMDSSYGSAWSWDERPRSGKRRSCATIFQYHLH
jgi:hypothetical protein